MRLQKRPRVVALIWPDRIQRLHERRLDQLLREDREPARLNQGTGTALRWYGATGNRTKMPLYNIYHDPVWNEETEQWEYTPDWETTTYQYSSRNELTKTYQEASDTTTTLSYDLRGNLTKKGSTEYYRDSQDHLTKVVKDGTTVQYKYDLFGRRVAKKVAARSGKWCFFKGLRRED